MVELDSKQWANLRHAYGSAEDVPPLLRQLASFPPSRPNAEPWHSLWSFLCHQGDVFSASFAAVPHIVQALAKAPTRAGFDFFLLPAAIDVARAEKSVPVPTPLQPAYSEALSNLPVLAAAVLKSPSNRDLSQSALAACAVGGGDLELARLLVELERGDIQEVIEWLRTR